MKIYHVFVGYETDGGFGDAIPTQDLVTSFVDRKDAEAFVEKYSHEVETDNPYAVLTYGELFIEEGDLVMIEDFDISKKPAEYDNGLSLPYFSGEYKDNKAEIEELWGFKED